MTKYVVSTWVFIISMHDEWIPLFSDIHPIPWILEYHGYLDTMDTPFFGYMDTWILWISKF